MFVKVNELWYEYDERRPDKLYNFHHGWTTKDKNTIIQDYVFFDNWHDVYETTGFNPLVDTTFYNLTGWLAPNGDWYPCEAHLCGADDIIELIYGEDCDYSDDELIKCGWVKLTNTLMLQYYIDAGMYHHLTWEQAQTLQNHWCVYSGIEFDELLGEMI